MVIKKIMFKRLKIWNNSKVETKLNNKEILVEIKKLIYNFQEKLKDYSKLQVNVTFGINQKYKKKKELTDLVNHNATHFKMGNDQLD